VEILSNAQESPVTRRKGGRESWEHAGAKWSISYILHELGFKVFLEPTIEVQGRSFRPDLIAIKDHAAIVVEIGQLQQRPIKFKDLYISVQTKYRDFSIRHVVLCNPTTEKFDYLLNIDPSDISKILKAIDQRKEPSRVLHFRGSYAA
jgi:hypothetical protein